jgi:lactate dehydrogenase-like 2-hydroxyacid dehydrogenase
MKKTILALIPLPEITLSSLAKEYELVYESDVSKQRALLMESNLSNIKAVVTNGTRGLNAEEFELLPSLQIVSAYGVGYENIDIEYAHQKGIHVTHCPGANDDTVADHTLGMMLCLARDFHRVDSKVKAGHWADIRDERPTLNLSRVGLFGLGRIGSKIALRADAFGMKVFYHTPQPKSVDWNYCASIEELADKSDYLVLACPGGQATFHAVNAEVLSALGPQGYLINIARGSVVDTQALIEALEQGWIAGAGLDVYEGEPKIDEKLLACKNTLFTPHMSGRSPAAYQVQTRVLLHNLNLQFSGQTPNYCI